MKACTTCGIEKPESDFHKNGKMGRHTSCKKCSCEKRKLWRLANPELAKERDRLKHEKHSEKRKAKMREYHANNADKRSEVERKRYERNKEKIKAKNYAYRKENRHLVMAWNNGRRAAEKRATPIWADYEKIAEFYKQSIVLTEQTGKEYHVDHIIPLRGKNVCGLHVENNLQVILACDNLKKGIHVEFS